MPINSVVCVSESFKAVRRRERSQLQSTGVAEKQLTLVRVLAVGMMELPERAHSLGADTEHCRV